MLRGGVPRSGGANVNLAAFHRRQFFWGFQHPRLSYHEQTVVFRRRGLVDFGDWLPKRLGAS